MRQGMVQEEILFMIMPELFISKVLCTKMEDNEAIVVTGAKRFSKYTGYSHKTTFAGVFEEDQTLDELNRIGMALLH